MSTNINTNKCTKCNTEKLFFIERCLKCDRPKVITTFDILNLIDIKIEKENKRIDAMWHL